MSGPMKRRVEKVEAGGIAKSNDSLLLRGASRPAWITVDIISHFRHQVVIQNKACRESNGPT